MIPDLNAPIGLKNVETTLSANVKSNSKVIYSSITLLPAIQEKENGRNWVFNFEGNVVSQIKRQNISKIKILMDFSKVFLASQYFIQFESRSVGTLILNEKVYSASRYINYVADNDKKTIEFTLTPPVPQRGFSFSWDIVLADCIKAGGSCAHDSQCCGGICVGECSFL